MKPTHPELLTVAVASIAWFIVVTALIVLPGGPRGIPAMLAGMASVVVLSLIARRVFWARARRRGERWRERR